MKIKIQKKYMFICALFGLFFCATLLFISFNTIIYAKIPENIIQNTTNDYLLLFNTYLYLEQENYEKAIEEFEKINFEDFKINLFNEQMFNQTVEHYQNLIIKKAKQLENEKKYQQAVELLESKINYFKNKTIIESLINKYKESYIEQGLIKYNGAVEHFFTHCLIAYPEIAFQKNNYMGKNYDIDCLTPKEFKLILENFYKRDYILISANSCFEKVNKVVKKKDLYLPKGKKPLILSFDDVNYDSKKMNKGMVDRIVVDSNGELAAFTQKNGINNQLTYNNEFIPILEQFVKDNPDFSFKGAKGLLCLTGYDGILGYRTNKSSITREQEIEKAKKIVSVLKDKGWEFACHSYGHGRMRKMSDEEFNEELKCWQDEVEPLIGKTKIYVYPYGEHLITNSNGAITYKHQILLDAGFELFCGVGCKYFYNYYPFNSRYAVLFMDRHPLDGQSLRTKKIAYQNFFDCEKVYDNSNRPTPY